MRFSFLLLLFSIRLLAVSVYSQDDGIVGEDEANEPSIKKISVSSESSEEDKNENSDSNEENERVRVRKERASNIEKYEEEEGNESEKVVKPWKKHDFLEKLKPKFLDRLSSNKKNEFTDIQFNPELSKAEKIEKMRDFGKQNDMEEEIEEYLEKKKGWNQKQKEERQKNYERLGELMNEANDILNNMDMTFNEAKLKIVQLMEDDDRHVIEAFNALYPYLKQHHKHRFGHHGHHGKRHPRNIGHGAQPKHHHKGGIGSGVSYDEPRHHNGGHKQQSYDPYGNQRHHRN